MSLGDGENSEDLIQFLPTIEDQKYLLQTSDQDSEVEGTEIKNGRADAPLFSADVFKLDDPSSPQHGLLGSISLKRQTSSWLESRIDTRIFHNTNVPFSVFVCGLQGSGKSHTTSCLIG